MECQSKKRLTRVDLKALEGSLKPLFRGLQEILPKEPSASHRVDGTPA